MAGTKADFDLTSCLCYKANWDQISLISLYLCWAYDSCELWTPLSDNLFFFVLVRLCFLFVISLPLDLIIFLLTWTKLFYFTDFLCTNILDDLCVVSRCWYSRQNYPHYVLGLRGNVEINKNCSTEKWSGAEKQHSHIQISDLDYAFILWYQGTVDFSLHIANFPRGTRRYLAP